jgi:hypothetical protein
MTSIKTQTEMSNTAMVDSTADASSFTRKPWSTPRVIVAAESRSTEGGNTRFTDGTSLGVPYGS